LITTTHGGRKRRQKGDPVPPIPNDQVSIYERALRIPDFCRRYGISRSTAYKLKAQGKLRIVKIAGRAVVPIESAEALLVTEAA
jgi:predicted DNA-binding transcriptional regulator AlpA